MQEGQARKRPSGGIRIRNFYYLHTRKGKVGKYPMLDEIYRLAPPRILKIVGFSTINLQASQL
jgi:hypothetical protein